MKLCNRFGCLCDDGEEEQPELLRHEAAPGKRNKAPGVTQPVAEESGSSKALTKTLLHRPGQPSPGGGGWLYSGFNTQPEPQSNA